MKGENENQPCQICGDARDENYPVYSCIWVIDPPRMPSRHKGETITPLCSSCYEAVYVVGIIK